LNIQTGKILVSENFGPLFGQPEGMAEVTYDSFLAVVYPDDWQALSNALQASVERGY
jgi:hypothetical protein